MDLKLGIAALLLLPGLGLYAGLFGSFGGHRRRDGRPFAPIAPSPNSVKAVIIILGGAVLVQGVSAALIALSKVMGDLWPIIPVFHDPFEALSKGSAKVDAHGLALDLLFIAAQSVGAFWLATRWVKRRLKLDDAPRWLFGWANWMAELADDGHVVIATILTDQDVPTQTHWKRDDGLRSVAYSGAVSDLALAPNGSIQRVNLVDCVRYLVDMREDISDGLLPEPLSHFEHFSIEAARIRNITFDQIDAPIMGEIDLGETSPHIPVHEQ